MEERTLKKHDAIMLKVWRTLKAIYNVVEKKMSTRPNIIQLAENILNIYSLRFIERFAFTSNSVHFRTNGHKKQYLFRYLRSEGMKHRESPSCLHHVASQIRVKRKKKTFIVLCPIFHQAPLVFLRVKIFFSMTIQGEMKLRQFCWKTHGDY